MEKRGKCNGLLNKTIDLLFLFIKKNDEILFQVMEKSTVKITFMDFKVFASETP